MAGFPFLTETVSSRAALLCFASFVVGAAVPSLYLIAFSSPTSPVSGPVVLSSSDPSSSPPDYCVTPAYPLEGLDSDWHKIKSIPPPAKCTVQGLPIEKLEPEYNFRRGYALGYIQDHEDKTHLLPYLRATRDLRLSMRRRRVLLDMGGREFSSSVLWFLRNYPLSFSEVYVFEAWPGRFRIPPLSHLPEQDLVPTMDNRSRVAGWGNLTLPDWALERIHLREEFVSIEDKAVPGQTVTKNITGVIKEELNLTRADTVIVKMDIEWAEWTVLPVWLEDPELPYIIDELFVEIHYQHPTMWPQFWNRGPPREKALEMYQSLRDKGFYAHPWP